MAERIRKQDLYSEKEGDGKIYCFDGPRGYLSQTEKDKHYMISFICGI